VGKKRTLRGVGSIALFTDDRTPQDEKTQGKFKKTENIAGQRVEELGGFPLTAPKNGGKKTLKEAHSWRRKGGLRAKQLKSTGRRTLQGGEFKSSRWKKALPR